MDHLVCVEDFQREAMQKLGKNARNFYSSAADDEITMKDNVDAFSRYIINCHIV